MRIIANDAKDAEFSGNAQHLDDDAIAELNTCEFHAGTRQEAY